MKRFRAKNGFGARRVARALSVGVIALMVGGCDGLFSTDEQEYITRGVDYYQEGRLNESIIEFRNALQKNPENARARYYLGIARIEAGDFASARRDLERARDLGYSDQELALPLAQARLMGGDDEGVLAIELPQELGQTETAELHALRGRAALSKEDIELAREEYRLALAADPGSANARFGQALIAQTGGDAERMREWLERTLSADENHAEAWRTRALLDQTQGRNDDAEAALTRAIETAATPADLYRRTMLRLQRDAADEARVDAERLVRVVPESARGHYALGLVYLYEDDASSAQAALENAVARDGRFSPARLMLGVIHGDAGRYAQARHQLERYRVLEPDTAVGSLMLAALEIYHDGSDSAKQKLEAHIESFPSDVHARSLLASLEAGEDTDDAMTRAAFSIMGRQDAFGPAGGGPGETSPAETSRGGASERPSNDDLETVRSVLADQEFEKALERVDALIDSYPEEGELHRLKAGAQMGLGQAQESFESLTRAIQLDPGNLDAIRNLGQLLVRAGEEDSALALFRRAREDHPEHLGLALGLAQMEQRAGNDERLEQLLVDSIEKHPEVLEPRVIYAHRLLSLGDPQGALEVIEPMADRHADHLARLIVEAQALEALGEFAEARSARETLVQSQPDNAQFRMALANHQIREGEHEAARETLQPVAEDGPASLGPRVLIMRTYLMENAHESAENEYQQMVEDFGESRALLSEGARLAFERGKTASGIDRLRRAYSIEPTEEGAINLARAHAGMDQHTKAITAIERWKEDAEGELSERAWQVLGGSHLAVGGNNEAIEIYERLLEADPDDPVTLNNLAWALHENDARRAVTLAERAVEKAPDSSEIQHTLVIALRSAGETSRSIDVMEDVVALDPNPEYRMELAKLYVDAQRSDDARRILEELANMEDFDNADRVRELLGTLSR